METAAVELPEAKPRVAVRAYMMPAVVELLLTGRIEYTVGVRMIQSAEMGKQLRVCQSKTPLWLVCGISQWKEVKVCSCCRMNQ